jgi:GxxExxY protein
MDERDVLALCDRIREISFALHGYLRHGHLEKVYENGLAHRLQKAGIRFDLQYPLKVWTVRFLGSTTQICLSRAVL